MTEFLESMTALFAFFFTQATAFVNFLTSTVIGQLLLFGVFCYLLTTIILMIVSKVKN